MGQSSPTDYKVGLWGIDCQFTTKEEERGGGGEIMKILRGLMRGSGKFYLDTTDILNPTTPSPSDDYQ